MYDPLMDDTFTKQDQQVRLRRDLRRSSRTSAGGDERRLQAHPLPEGSKGPPVRFEERSTGDERPRRQGRIETDHEEALLQVPQAANADRRRTGCYTILLSR